MVFLMSGHDVLNFLFQPISRSFNEHFPLHLKNVSLMTLMTSQFTNGMDLLFGMLTD